MGLCSGGDRRGDRAIDVFALLGLLPGVGEDAHRAAQGEQAARELGGHAELGVDNRGHAVHVPALDVAVRPCRGQELQGRTPARIHRMEPVPETRQVRGVAPLSCHDHGRRRRQADAVRCAATIRTTETCDPSAICPAPSRASCSPDRTPQLRRNGSTVPICWRDA